MKHPLYDSKETEDAFLARMEAGQDVASADAKMLVALVRHWRRLETEAAAHVESVICMRSPHFTGDQPYVGWSGCGLALNEDYDELERLRKHASSAIN